MTSIQNGQNLNTTTLLTSNNKAQNEQLAQSFQQQIDALKEQLEAAESENENASPDEPLTSAVAELQALIASLQSQKEALLSAVDDQITMTTQELVGDLSTLEPADDTLFTAALQGTKEATAAPALAINTPTSEDDKADKAGTLLNKSLVSAGSYPIPKDAKQYYNPLEVTDTTPAADANTLRFTDEHSGKTIQLKLDSDNAQKLTEKFGSLQAAEDYVKSWYYEAAYGVGYLEFDSDGNGTISQQEAKALKALVALGVEPPNNYRSLNEALANDADRDRFLEEFGFIDSLEMFINHSIRQDKDSSGTLEFAELAGKNSEKVAQKVTELQESGDDALLDIFAFNRLLLGTIDNTDVLLSLFGNQKSEEGETSEPADSIASQKATESDASVATEADDSAPAAATSRASRTSSAKITA